MQKNKQRPGVMMYFHLVRPMKCLSKEQFSDLIWALLDYAEFGALPVFEDPMLQMSWGYLQHAADVDLERYETRCKNARDAIEKRWHGTGDTNVYDGIPNMPNTNTKAEADTNTKGKSKADADAVGGTVEHHRPSGIEMGNGKGNARFFDHARAL